MATSVTVGASVALGLGMFALVVVLSWVSTNYGVHANTLKWIGLPLLAYGITLGVNSLIQYTSCQSVNMKQVAVSALFVPGAVLVGLVLTLLGIVRSPIEKAVPLVYRLQYGGVIALAYYCLWAAMFGEAVAGGFAQSCS